MEKQRQLEWEKQRISEMQLQRQREQEKVLKLKAQNQTYSIELSQLNEKIKELSQKICDTRAGVTNVKTVIDGMRSTRDTQMSDMSQLKTRIKEQNQKLVHLSQEKAKLDSKNKMTADGGGYGASATAAHDAAFSNKQIIINQLKGKIETTKQELAEKSADCTTNGEQLTELKTTLSDLIAACEQLYGEYDVQRCQIQELKNNRKNESITSAWDTANNSSWGPADSTASNDYGSSAATVASSTGESAAAAGGYDGYVRYRAIYEFVGRNSDELTFQPGDIVMVPLEQNAEPGWYAGEINGHTGWFPETYVERIDDDADGGGGGAGYQTNDILDNKRQLEWVVLNWNF